MSRTKRNAERWARMQNEVFPSYNICHIGSEWWVMRSQFGAQVLVATFATRDEAKAKMMEAFRAEVAAK